MDRGLELDPVLDPAVESLLPQQLCCSTAVPVQAARGAGGARGGGEGQ